jgi:alanine-glyoxylate transaminase/serine-glyoxylate transaminase/serine-pyruvate transaminase
MVSIPGPSTIPDRVLNAMHRPMPNIYEGELVDIVHEVLDRLPAIARTTTAHPFIAISNGHGAWQMAINNTLSRGDKVLVLESGRFAPAWGEMAAVGGVEVETLTGDFRTPVDVDAFAERLAADTDRSIKAVFVVLADTASSVRNNIASLGRALRDADHPALFMVDCIASLGCDVYEMDAWGVDVTVAGSQKGLMVPPGLGFVWAGPRALAAYDTADLKDGYFDWGPRRNPDVMYKIFAGTPPIQHLYGLTEALDMIDEEGGLEPVWARHTALADAIRAAINAWSTDGGIEFNVTDPAARSDAVTTVLTGRINGPEMRKRAEEGAGLVVGLGLGGMDQAFRIGHMGHLNPPHVLGTLGTIEATLQAMDAPIGSSGVASAARALAPHL